jgi:hypothetical protein
MNAPLGHSVRVISHPPEHKQTSTDRIEAALNALVEDGKRSRPNSRGESH